jgi:hypothetical protein
MKVYDLKRVHNLFLENIPIEYLHGIFHHAWNRYGSMHGEVMSCECLDIIALRIKKFIWLYIRDEAVANGFGGDLY